MSKQYGLILPDKQGAKKAPPIFAASKNVFGDDSDSDDAKEVAPKRRVVTSGDKIQRQAKAVQEKALEEDPTVYQYDELYDDMEDKKKLTKASTKTEDKKPKYIEKLLQTAEKRKKENERRIERQVQKEREEEGDKFADKEAFITSSYKKKLEEMKLEEEKEKRENYLEEIGDVTKQTDLGGFYRHLYEQQLRPEKPQLTVDSVLTGPSKVKTEHPSSPEEKSENSDNEEKKPNKKNNKEKRTYRKRPHPSAEQNEDQVDSDDAEETRKNLEDIKLNKKAKTHMQSNIDADSDFSIDESSSSDDDEGDKVKKNKTKSENKPKDTEVKPVEDDKDTFKKPEDAKAIVKEGGDKKVKNEEKKSVDLEVKETKPKIDIWKKRTVGEVLDQAIQRYYQRKAARGC